VLASDYRRVNVLSSASADLRDTEETPSDNNPAGSRSYVPSPVALSSTTSSHSWTPQQFQQAYNVPLTQQNNRPGYGIKVAIITAYHYANLQSDLNKWASRFSQKAIILNIINQAGNVGNSSWALQTNVAVQMVNTVSPGATVYVIEAKSVSQTDIRVAMQTAVNLGVNIVSMPFGAAETFSEGSQASLFLSNRVVWIAASGDSNTPSFPATYPDVIAVGGTTLSSVDPLVETAWIYAGAGMSIVEKMPGFQMTPSVQQRNTTAYRSVPDVAFSADPNYGAQIYISVLGGWVVVGGTSVSTAFFTGVVAMVDSARKSQNLPLLTSVVGQSVLLQDSLYKLMSTNGGPTNSTILHDVVEGIASEGSYPAGPGYDIATGLGSLNVEKFIDYMVTQ
jgi:subtilase family serine protease